MKIYYKTCTKCNIKFELNKENFNVANKNIDGFTCLCKTCKKAIDKEHREKNREKIKEYQRSPRYVYIQIKASAKRRKIPFLLDEDYYIKNLAFKPCFYCGSDNTKHWIDRVDNDHAIGYTEKNSVPCCQLCNRMKMDLDFSLFIEQCKKIINKINIV
jgi:hypothetical protein